MYIISRLIYEVLEFTIHFLWKKPLKLKHMDNFTIFNTSIKCGMQTICSLAGRNPVNLSMQIDNINNMS